MKSRLGEMRLPADHNANQQMEITTELSKKALEKIQYPTLVSVYRSVCNPEIHRVLREL